MASQVVAVNLAVMRTLVMGIVNVTPDSFSDGNRYFTVDEAERRARNLAADGADVLDIGGESTRPGATPVSPDEEWRRISPVLERLAAHPAKPRKGAAVPISVDTYHIETAVRALDLGVSIINCVKEECASKMLALCREKNREVVIPAKSFDVLDDDLRSYPGIIIDPMIGFGTTREQDLALLRSVGSLARSSRVLVGASRKRIVKALTGEKIAGKDIGGNLAIAIYAALQGAYMVRVHDVKETVQALKVMEILQGRGTMEQIS